MTIGVISDIHNNPAALEAVLAEFNRRAVDGVICLGDIIGIGAQPEETVSLVRNIPSLLAYVRGNHEGYLLSGEYDDMDDEERQFHIWEHDRISASAREFLAAAPMEANLVIDGVSIWAAHYPMTGQRFYDIDPLAVADRCPDAQVCLFGHDHTRSIFEKNGCLYANFGSLGCPGRDKNIARAGLLFVQNHTVRPEPLDIEYDVQPTISIMNQLDPPARKTVQAIFYGI